MRESEKSVVGRRNDNVTLMAAFWNEAYRLPELLDHLDRYFRKWAIAVQKSDDHTLEICEEYETDERIIVPDAHRGVGEASFNMLLKMIDTEWVFVVSADEWPESGLLAEMPKIIDKANAEGRDGVWLPFRSWIEEFEFTGDQEAHLRLFRRRVGWPSSMHSRPMTENTLYYPSQYSIHHKRSLDEMMLDYLRYYEMGKHSEQWKAHNKVMMHDACEAIAQRKGWDFVQTKPWWPEVAKIAF
jgi:hypothetical protein